MNMSTVRPHICGYHSWVPPALVILGAFFLLVGLGHPATAHAEECQPCTQAQQKAEFDQMMDLYRKAIQNARDNGYQCGSDPNYSDPGDGKHKVGNCIDWAQTSWTALVVRTWDCWHVVKIRARRKFSIRAYHHFVYIVPKCGGKKIYLDPWTSGRPDTYSEDVFPFKTGFFSLWIHYPLDRHNAGDRPKSP
jgi:hypothetical protein